MSTALAIAGVSAVLEFYLGNIYTGLSPMFGGTVGLSAQAPDLVQASFGQGAPAENQVNLFLHQVTYNAAWRNMQLPSLAADGQTLLQSPPLALDLHYLLTVYGTADWQAEGLLGYALMMFHENPVISRSDIAYALAHLPPGNKLSSTLANCGLADQVETIKITPATLGREEMAWLWTALKADYRPTFPFQVSVVLMQPQQNTSVAIPVLRRHVQAQVTAPAQILAVTPPNNQPAAAFTDTVTVTGEFLAGFTQVALTNARLQVQLTVPATAVSATALTFVPGQHTTPPASPPAGVYTLTAQTVDGAGNVAMTTNELGIALASLLPEQTASVTTGADGSLMVTVTGIAPPVWEGQTVSLSLTDLVAPPPPAPLYSISAGAQPFSGNANTSLSFKFPSTLPRGVKFLARLIVDGVSSAVQVNWGNGNTPPSFSGPWVTVP